MAAELTNAEKIRRLPWNIALNATNNVFATLTFFGSAFVLFLNKLGASNSDIGFLLSLLPFSGIVALFEERWVVEVEKALAKAAKTEQHHVHETT